MRIGATLSLGMLVLIGLAGCRTQATSSAFIGTPTIEHAQANGDVWSTAGGLPAGSTPAQQPTFECCERAISISGTPKASVRSTLVDDPGGMGRVRQLDVTLHMPVHFDCRERDGSPDCLGTFQTITAVREPRIRRAGDAKPSVVDPVSHRVWWTMASGACDGRKYKGDLAVEYLARYDDTGVPTGKAADHETLILDLTSPTDEDGKRKGSDYRLTVEIWQDDASSPVHAKVTSLRKRS